ncbi:MAG: hypothetical protein OEW39_07175 [Deltaproteobacteria bacterium]|nr:hypothetical protein [Deltaproteobacteria bacterium]
MVPIHPKRRTTPTLWKPLPVCLALLGVLAMGCLPAGAEFDFGVGTSQVSGVLEGPSPGESVEDPLVVVLKHHHTFIETPSGVLRQPTAHVVSVNSVGGFLVEMPSDVVEMDVWFMGKNRLSDTLHLRRQIGVGAVRYRAVLRPMADWRGHFFTYIEPQMQTLITEARYRLAPEGQQRLGEWLLRNRSRLLSPPDAGGTPPLAPAPVK